MAKITLKTICKDIVLAQVCSDAGKRIYKLYLNNEVLDNKAKYFKYKDKVHYCLRAIRQIDNVPYLGATYHVSYEGNNMCIVYFNIHINGMKYQVSFHNPGQSENSELRKYVGKTPRIRWNKKVAGSRAACEKLISIFGY